MVKIIFSTLQIRSILVLIATIFLCSTSFAQPTQPQTVDIIYMKDGRVLRGEILLFEEKDGDITFQDTYGRKYSITREEYKYFEENQVVKERGSKRDTVTLSRKENQFEFSVGLSWGWYNPSSSFTADDYYLSNLNNNSFYPISVHAGVGKYFNRKHFVGLNADFSIISIASPVMNVNARYAYQYDAYKKNTACYIPVEVGFHSLTNSTSFYVDDTLDITDNSWTNQLDVDVKTTALNVGIGHGFNFMMKNKRSFAVELLIYKYFIMNENFENLTNGTPNFKSSPIGGKLAFYVNI
jgi:hypothetical protein